MSRKHLTIFALTFLTLCSPAVAETDSWGNVYPEVCEDVSGVDLPILTVAKLPFAPGHTADGLWLKRPSGNVILIRSGLSDAVRADAIRHEKCHQIIYELTGSPEWHD